MNLELEGKCALVSGGSRGIGRSIALTLAEEGCHVAVVARGEEGLRSISEELASSGGGPHTTISADVTRAEGAAHAVDSALAALGRLDVVVANVGKSGARHARDMDDDDFSDILDHSLWSTMRVCRLAIPHLRKQGGGAIVMTASIWGREAGGSPSYNVAKAGVISLSKAMARDYAKENIRVNSVAPGSILFPGGSWDRRQKEDPQGIDQFIETELPFGRFGKPEEVANVVTFLCSPKAQWISGACIVVDGCQSMAF